MREECSIAKVENGFVVTYLNSLYNTVQKIFTTLSEVYDFLKEYYEEE